jgi:flagellar basal body-associated protein FliL
MISNENLILMALAAIVIYFMFIQKEKFDGLATTLTLSTIKEEEKRQQQQKATQSVLNALKAFRAQYAMNNFSQAAKKYK